MSKVLKIGGGVVLAFVLFFAGVMWLTNGPAAAATAFFQSCVTDGLDSAYEKASPGFRAAVTRTQFAEFAAAYQLSSFKSASWRDRHIEAGESVVKGTLSMSGDVVRPLTVALVKSGDGTWRVLSVRFDQVGVVDSGGTAPSPAQTAHAVQTAVSPSAPSGVRPVAATSSENDAGIEHVDSVQPLPANVTFEQIKAYLRQAPVYQRALSALKRGQERSPGYCPSMKLRSVYLLVAQGPEMDANGAIVGGAFRESWMGMNCGDAHPRLNVWTVVQPNQPPSVFLSYNGTSNADPQLQHDGYRMALASANAKVPNCARMEVADTHFETYEGSPVPASGGRNVRPWREAWLMVGCQHAVKVVVHFVPDSSGTSTASRSDESVLLQ